MLENSVTLASLNAKLVSLDAFRGLCPRAAADGNVYCARTTMPGAANPRVLGPLPSGSEKCQKVMNYLRRPAPHMWREETVVLVNAPCYVITKCGAIVTNNGSVIQESVYPSAGESTYERILDIDVRAEGF